MWEGWKGREEDKRADARSCLDRKGALEGKPAISTTAVATEGSLVKAAPRCPRYCSSIASPKHKLSSRRGQSKVKGGKGRRGISRRAGQCIQLNPLQRNRRAPPDRTNARTYLHNHLCSDSVNMSQKMFKLISKKKYPTAASQRSSSRPGCLPFPQHSMFSAAPAVVVKLGICGGRAAVTFVVAPALILDAVALVGLTDWLGRTNKSPRESSSSCLGVSPPRLKSTALLLQQAKRFLFSVPDTKCRCEPVRMSKLGVVARGVRCSRWRRSGKTELDPSCCFRPATTPGGLKLL